MTMGEADSMIPVTAAAPDPAGVSTPATIATAAIIADCPQEMRRLPQGGASALAKPSGAHYSMAADAPRIVDS
jgi:hypothetical protein